MMISTAFATPKEHLMATDDLALRQLRHQTKNALQRVMCQIAACRDLQATPHGRGCCWTWSGGCGCPPRCRTRCSAS